jgi:hypothetical protein
LPGRDFSAPDIPNSERLKNPVVFAIRTHSREAFDKLSTAIGFCDFASPISSMIEELGAPMKVFRARLV